WFVVKKDLTRNVLVVAQGTDHPLLFNNRLFAQQAHWINGAPPAYEFNCTAKVHYRQADQRCAVTVNTDSTLTVLFAEPQRAITPGQSVVFYQGDVCLGGAVIEATDNIAFTF